MAAENSRRFSYVYPRPALTVDLVVVSLEPRPHVLLIRRRHDPFVGSWALPGGFVEDKEGLADAARREMAEETGVVLTQLEQLYTFGDPGRDPRGWVVSVAYLARVNRADVKPDAGDDAEEAAWFPLDDLPKLAFDHAAILERARARMGEGPKALARG